MPPRRAADVFYDLFCRFLHRPGFLSHLRSLQGDDEPGIPFFNHRNEIQIEFSRVERRLHLFLRVKNPRGATTLILITARPRFPSSIFNPLSPRERICRRAKDPLVKARGRRRAVTSARPAPEMRVSLTSRRASPLDLIGRKQSSASRRCDHWWRPQLQTRRRISVNKILGMTTSAIWKAGRDRG